MFGTDDCCYVVIGRAIMFSLFFYKFGNHLWKIACNGIFQIDKDIKIESKGFQTFDSIVFGNGRFSV